MTTWWLKGCSRCGGDLYSEKDTYGWFVRCLQCGRELTAEQVSLLVSSRTEALAEEEMPVAA